MPKLIQCLILVFIALWPAMTMAQETRSVDVRFPRGTSGTTINDSITGYQSVDYRLDVSAGQRMSVELDTDNASSYFNIAARGAEALYNGSISGNATSVVIPSSGSYIITVYLMRNAARRNETANYALTLYVEGAAAAAPRPTPAPAPDFADGLAGGPDFWQVEGLSGGDTLNVRSGPSTGNAVIGTVRNGDTLQNFGCTMAGSTRWCQVQTRSGIRGWVAGRYLHESFGTAQPPRRPTPAPVPLPTPVPANPAPDRLDTSLMPRFCAGEASAKFGVRPQQLTTNIAFRSGGNYVVQGYFDRDGSSTFFNCYFDLAGNFVQVN